MAVTKSKPVEIGGSRLQEFLSEPRAGLNTLSKSEFEGKTVGQQRFIVILEQIGFKLGVESQRQLANRLGIRIPNLQGWLRAEIADPNTIRREDLEKIAIGRGITLPDLRIIIDGLDPFTRQFDNEQEWIGAIQRLPISVLIDGIEKSIHRIKSSLPDTQGTTMEDEAPHTGNQKLYQLLEVRQTDLGADRFDQLRSIFFLSDDHIEKLLHSPDPIPNEALAPLSGVLGMPVPDLIFLRDGEPGSDDDDEEDNSRELPTIKPTNGLKPKAKRNSSTSRFRRKN